VLDTARSFAWLAAIRLPDVRFDRIIRAPAQRGVAITEDGVHFIRKLARLHINRFYLVFISIYKLACPREYCAGF